MRTVPFDPFKSFSWIGTPGFGPSVPSVGPALKVNTVKELVAHGLANPGKLTSLKKWSQMHLRTSLAGTSIR